MYRNAKRCLSLNASSETSVLLAVDIYCQNCNAKECLKRVLKQCEHNCSVAHYISLFSTCLLQFWAIAGDVSLFILPKKSWQPQSLIIIIRFSARFCIQGAFYHCYIIATYGLCVTIYTIIWPFILAIISIMRQSFLFHYT